MLRAIIFDFDGVLADSEPLHYKALLNVAETFGVSFTYPQYLQRIIGFDDRDAFRDLLSGRYGAVNWKPSSTDKPELSLEELIERKACVFEELVSQGAALYPGVTRLIEEVSAELPIAIASGALRRDIEAVLGPLDLVKKFNPIVTADLVERSKPDPESYVMAFEQLKDRHESLTDMEPWECLAIEDTPAGIAAAKDAGLYVLGVSSTCDQSSLTNAHRVIPKIQTLTLAKLQRWFE